MTFYQVSLCSSRDGIFSSSELLSKREAWEEAKTLRDALPRWCEVIVELIRDDGTHRQVWNARCD